MHSLLEGPYSHNYRQYSVVNGNFKILKFLLICPKENVIIVVIGQGSQMTVRVLKNGKSIQAQSRTLVAQVDASIETRTETLMGRNYYVVPVVAMVEGVRTGANAEAPELGLASEFAQDLITWANRPLVLNHPQIELDGEMVYCSANDPAILESYAFGITMNPYLEDSKLKMEAWIDVGRVEDLGGEFETIVQAIQNTEPVEVSVGFFSKLEEKSGKFRGQSYKAIWRDIKPDHLAVLSLGTLGACSQADGCGIPRINQVKEADMTTPEKNKGIAKSLMNIFGIKTDPVAQSGCGCGGAEASCLCSDKEHKFHTHESVQQHLAEEGDREQIRAFMQGLVAQSISANVMDGDVRKLISNALKMKYPNNSVYLIGYTLDVAIFEAYGYFGGDYQYQTFQVAIEVSDTSCTLTGDPTSVTLMTKIVPQTAGSEANDPKVQEPAATSATSEVVENPESQTVTQESEMGEQTTQPNAANPESAAPVTQAAPVVQATTTMTVQEYIAAAPEGMREVLQSGIRAHNERKDILVKKITANAQNKFAEAELRAFSIDLLENIVALTGDVTPNYQGVAAPAPTVQQVDNSVPAPPRLFEVKK